MRVQTFTHSLQEAEVGISSLSSKTSWSTYQILDLPGVHRETLSTNKILITQIYLKEKIKVILIIISASKRQYANCVSIFTWRNVDNREDSR